MLAPLVPELQQIKRELLMNYANETAVAQVAKAEAMSSKCLACSSDWWHVRV